MGDSHRFRPTGVALATSHRCAVPVWGYRHIAACGSFPTFVVTLPIVLTDAAGRAALFGSPTDTSAGSPTVVLVLARRPSSR
jgi:hypothetical protein